MVESASGLEVSGIPAPPVELEVIKDKSG